MLLVFFFTIFISLASMSTMIMLIVELIILTTFLLPRFIYNAEVATRPSPWLSGRKRFTSILMIALPGGKSRLVINTGNVLP